MGLGVPARVHMGVIEHRWNENDEGRIKGGSRMENGEEDIGNCKFLKS